MTATLYATKGGSSASALYTIDPSTAAQTSVGATGHAFTGLAFDPTDGTLYGITSLNSPPAGTGKLYTIDTATGAATLVATLNPIGFAGRTAADICFDASGQMYALPAPAFGGAGTRKLWKIDKATGAVTEVGSDIGFNFFGNGVTYRDSDNTLLGFPGGGYCATCTYPADPWGWVYTIDPTTGAFTKSQVIVGGTANDNPAIGAAALDGAGLVWAITNDFPACELVTIDPADGTCVSIGSLANGFDALAWSPAPVAPPPNDLCANAEVISGTSGTTSGTTAGAGIEAADPLEAFYSITLANSVFYEYVAPADGYIQFTLSGPDGADKVVAGAAFGTCGSLAVSTDTLVGQATYRETVDGAPPATFGHQIAAGETVYVEVAIEDAGGVPGPFTLAWELRTIGTFDCPGDGEQFGDPVPDEDPITLDKTIYALDYLQDAGGNHWIAYWTRDDNTTTTSDLRVAMGDPTATSWTSWVVLADARSNGVSLPFIQLVSDGTKVWVMCLIKEAPTKISVAAFEYGGGTWPQVATLSGQTGDNTGSYTARIGAHSSEPGVAYIAFANEDGAGSEQTIIAKVDDTTTLWSTVALSLYSNWLAITNGSGSPVLFFAPASGFTSPGTDLQMYSIDPATGVATLLQSVNYAELGQASTGDHKLVGMNLSMEPFVDAIDAVSVFYVTVIWRSPSLNAFNIYRVPADGSADFDWFDLDITRGLAPYPGGSPFNGGIFPEADSVWLAENAHLAQFTRQCGDDWTLWPVTDFVSGGSADTDDIVKIGDYFWYAAQFEQSVGDPASTALVVARTQIQRDGCFCSIGPEVALGRFYAQVV